MMYQSKLVLATLLLSSSSVAAFNPRLGGNNPTFRALQIRGGDEPDVTEMKTAEELNVVTEDVVEETITVVDGETEPATAEVGSEPVAAVEEPPPSSLPTYQRMMNKVRQPTSEDPIVDSLLVETSEVVEDAIDTVPDATTSSGVGMIPTALAFATNIKTTLISLDAAYPVLKYVVAVIVAAILINMVTGMLSSGGGVDEQSVPETSSITAEPVETGSVGKKDQNVAQTALALAVGAVGLIAGSLAMVADGADDEDTTTSFRPRSTATATAASSEEEDDSSEGGIKNLSNLDKVKIGAGSAALVGGISSRAVILGKVLSIWF